jgi:hypothetical protein
MSTTEDAEKFMAVAGSNLANVSEESSSDDDIYPDDPEDGYVPGRKKYPAGADVQYAYNGPGFVPVSKTVAKLDAGVYSITGINNQWTFVPHKLVSDQLLRLPDSKSEYVIQEIERFWTLKKAFKEFGYTHKRGFLLWGPPGSGKTATVTMVVKNMVERNGLVFLADNHPGIVASLLRRFRQVEPCRPALVILEDIDAYVRQHGESEVLSILDGEQSIDNVVYIATTNYPENLDPRVINRPSRFDLIMLIDMPNADARRLYLKSRDTKLDDVQIEQWVKDTDGFSIAHLKELIVGVCLFGKPVEEEIKRLKAMMKRQPSSTDGKGSMGF